MLYIQALSFVLILSASLSTDVHNSTEKITVILQIDHSTKEIPEIFFMYHQFLLEFNVMLVVDAIDLLQHLIDSTVHLL